MTMKKSAILISMIAGFAAITASAQQSASSYKITTDFSYNTQYVFRGFQKTADAFVSSVEVATGDYYAGIWTMQPISAWKGERPCNEIDFNAGYRKKVWKDLSVEGVATCYWYPDARSSVTGTTSHSYELGAGAVWTRNRLSSSAFLHYDFRLQAPTGVASVGYSFPVVKLATSVDVAFYIGTTKFSNARPNVPGPRLKYSYNYYGFDVSVPYHINERARVTASVHYANNDHTPLDTRDNRFWFRLGLSLGF